MEELLLGVLLALGFAVGAFYLIHRRGWMRNGYFTIGTSILIAVLVMVLYQTIGGVLVVMVDGTRALTDPDSGLMLGMNAISQLLVLIGGTWILIKATDQDFATTLRFEGINETPLSIYIIAPPITLLVQFVGGLLSVAWTELLKQFVFYDALKNFEDKSEAMIAELVTAGSVPELIFIFLAVAITPAIAEEIFFRGFLQTNIERSGHRHSRPYAALLIASLVFAIVHFSVFKLPGLLLLGLAMGYMSYRTNNLLVGSLAHAFNNGFIVLMLYLFAESFAGTEPKLLLGNEDPKLEEIIAMSILFIPMLGFGLYLFHKWTEPLRARDLAEEEVVATTAYYDALALVQTEKLTHHDPNDPNRWDPDNT